MTRVPLQAIQVSRFQPRRNLNEERIQELATSIRDSGLIYPLLVRNIAKSGAAGPAYELIAGERRFRALRLIGETQAPVVVREADDKTSLELALVENLQREALNAMEQAHGYQRLQTEFDLTQEEVASSVGKDRVSVANTLRLLRLPQSVQDWVAQGKLSFGQARALLGLTSQRAQVTLAQKTVSQGLSVRRLEQLVQQMTSSSSKKATARRRDPEVVAVEQKLQRTLGTQVQISNKQGKGWVKIAYFSLKDLDRLISKLSR